MSTTFTKISQIAQNQSTPNFTKPDKSFNGNTPKNLNSSRKSMNSDEKRGVERFRRVKEEEVQIDHRVVDNSFEAKVSVLKFSKRSQESWIVYQLKTERKREENFGKIVGRNKISLQLLLKGHSLFGQLLSLIFIWSSNTFLTISSLFLFMYFSDAP